MELRRATRRERAAPVVDAAVCLAVALLLAGVVGESDPGPPWRAIGTAAAGGAGRRAVVAALAGWTAVFLAGALLALEWRDA